MRKLVESFLRFSDYLARVVQLSIYIDRCRLPEVVVGMVTNAAEKLSHVLVRFQPKLLKPAHDVH
jgi:hypothetical protein